MVVIRSAIDGVPNEPTCTQLVAFWGLFHLIRITLYLFKSVWVEIASTPRPSESGFLARSPTNLSPVQPPLLIPCRCSVWHRQIAEVGDLAIVECLVHVSKREHEKFFVLPPPQPLQLRWSAEKR